MGNKRWGCCVDTMYWGWGGWCSSLAMDQEIGPGRDIALTLPAKEAPEYIREASLRKSPEALLRMAMGRRLPDPEAC